jgi:hypothetical protein
VHGIDGVDGTDPDGLDPAEAELRGLMHGLVGELKPAPQALDRLRVAVPLRRARRRQVRTGLVAACVLAVAAVPVALHAANASRSAGPTPANVASTSDAHGHSAHPDSTGSPRAGWNGGGGAASGRSGSRGRTHGTGKGGSAAASAPACTAADLGTPTSAESPIGDGGQATGWFRVVNTSTAACSVGPDSAGTLSLSAQDGADPSRFSLAEHTTGDASGLGAVGGTVVVKPGQAYEVQFGFAPDAVGCPAGGDTGGASPSPTPTGGTDGSGDSGSTGASGSAGGSTGGTGTDEGSSGSGSSGSSGTSGSSGASSSSSSSDGGAAAASGSDVSLVTSASAGTLVVTYTPPGGGTIASAWVRGVCGGTVFRNAPVAAS